ncbi:hypothetical protein MKX01_037039 [Papaver californicum]|nr:hypothetical protein MKX01_037039 [Papaver californicum]
MVNEKRKVPVPKKTALKRKQTEDKGDSTAATIKKVKEDTGSQDKKRKQHEDKEDSTATTEKKDTIISYPFP